MSSINLSNNFGRIINENADVHSIKGITCNFLKKMFKCTGIAEEVDDYETKDTKAAKPGKGIVLLDYLIPLHTSLSPLNIQIGSKGKNYIENPLFSFGFHGKIHLRPPQRFV